MKLLVTFLVVGGLALFFGCKSSTETNNSNQHLWTDADGNVHLQPPAPGEGIQIEVDTFGVPFNTEVQGDFYFQLPTTSDITIGRIEIAMNDGSHHMNCFRTDVPFITGQSGDTLKYTQLGDTTAVVTRPMYFTHDGKVDTEYVPYQKTFYVNTVWANSDMMIEAQIPHLDWDMATMPTDNSVPASLQGKKTTVVLKAGQKMIVETHFVNATVQSTPSGKGKVYINLYYATEANTTGASMYVAKYVNLLIPANTLNYTVPITCVFPPTVPFPIYLLGMTGHYHSHGKNFYVDVVQIQHDQYGNPLYDSTGQPLVTVVTPKIYSNPTWAEPPFTAFDTPIKLDSGQTIRYTAIYDNPTSSIIPFGGHVLTQEHDNLFVWFVPGFNNNSSIYYNGP